LTLTVCLAAGTTRAEAETIDFLGLGHHSVVEVSGPVSGTVYAGELNWQWLGTPPDGFGQSFYTFCLDILSYLTDPQDVTVRSTDDLDTTPDAGAKAAWLVNTYAAPILDGGGEANVLAAALQVAVWEAVYDSVNSLSSGVFSLVTTGDIRDQADAYLSALYYAPGTYYTSDAVWLDTRNGQDQIVVSSVPEPATLSLLGFGCLLLGGRRRRRLTCAL
jgi:hypothetical protein